MMFMMMSVFAAAPRAQACPADYNQNQSLSVQDIFDFLDGWFSGETKADYNCSGSVTVQDIFDFLAGWFAGCDAQALAGTPGQPRIVPIGLWDVSSDGQHDRGEYDLDLGEMTIIDGVTSGVLARVTATADVQSRQQYHGIAVRSAGDVDGDGRGDLLVAAISAPLTASPTGVFKLCSVATGDVLSITGDHPVPGGAQCADDLNGDGEVNGADTVLMMLLLGSSPAKIAADPLSLDVNGDGVVNMHDAVKHLRLVESWTENANACPRRTIGVVVSMTPPVVGPVDPGVAGPVTPGQPSPGDVPNPNPNCITVTTYPAHQYGGDVCGAWGMTTEGITSPISFTIRTCYQRNCAQLQRSIVLSENTCVTPPLVTISFMYRVVSYVDSCCLFGLGGTPPPIPCTSEPHVVYPRRPWKTTIPPVPGNVPGINWPVEP